MVLRIADACCACPNKLTVSPLDLIRAMPVHDLFFSPIAVFQLTAGIQEDFSTFSHGDRRYVQQATT